MDKLTNCKRCDGNACYEQVISEELTTWMCMGCGFTTSTLMNKDSKVVTDLLETSPELYKDLLHEDIDGRTWAPATISLPEKGMVFLDGNNSKNWQWAAVKSILITEEDRKLKQFPKDQTHKMDMKSIKHFGQKDFMDACDEIGFFNV